MKKEQMKKILDEQSELIQQLRNELFEAKKSHTEEIQSIHKEQEETAYQNWKSQNGEFIKRFIKEYLKDSLEIRMKTDYSGYVETSVYLENEFISHDSETVCVTRNGLEE